MTRFLEEFFYPEAVKPPKNSQISHKAAKKLNIYKPPQNCGSPGW
jgi:hypothetical protein